MDVWKCIQVMVVCVIYDVDEVIFLVDWVVMMLNGLNVWIGNIMEVDLLWLCLCKELFVYLDYYVYCEELLDFFQVYEGGVDFSEDQF